MPNKSEIEARTVELAGVPTLPDELLHQYRAMGLRYVEPEPTGELLDYCQMSIEAACREIRRRTERPRRATPRFAICDLPSEGED